MESIVALGPATFRPTSSVAKPSAVGDDLVAALCQGAVPDDPLRQLCKTNIIRDEWIAALSLDLSETQRFDLVRAALGSIEGADLAAKAKAVVNFAEATCSRVENAYEQARSQLSVGLVQRSEANDAAAKSSDVTAALAVLDGLVPPGSGDLAQRLDVARRDLPERRRRLEGMNEAIFQGREIAGHKATYNSPKATAQQEQARTSLADARTALAKAQAEVDQALRLYEVEAKANEIAASLSSLVEHGEALGLHDDHCPLCAAQRTPAEFQAGITLARARALIVSLPGSTPLAIRWRLPALEWLNENEPWQRVCGQPTSKHSRRYASGNSRMSDCSNNTAWTQDFYLIPMVWSVKRRWSETGSSS
jgi:hypothetical protein